MWIWSSKNVWAAIDDKLYNRGEKCGICYELVGPKGAV